MRRYHKTFVNLFVKVTFQFCVKKEISRIKINYKCFFLGNDRDV